MEFYFNRDPFLFNQIINAYNEEEDGSLHLNEGICYDYLIRELKYWQLERKLIEKCCRVHLNERRDFIAQEIKDEEQILAEIELKYDFGQNFLSKLREKLWNAIEKPQDNIMGKV